MASGSGLCIDWSLVPHLVWIPGHRSAAKLLQGKPKSSWWLEVLGESREPQRYKTTHSFDPRVLGRRIRQALQGLVPLEMPPWEIYLFIYLFNQLLPALCAIPLSGTAQRSAKDRREDRQWIRWLERGPQTLFLFDFIYQLPFPSWLLRITLLCSPETFLSLLVFPHL